MTHVDRYWKYVKVMGPNECWPWQGAKSKGYGRIRVNRRLLQATHIALDLVGRPRLSNLDALHSCDNPPCCNPAHLNWGTKAQNTRDMINRGRNSAITKPNHSLRGEKHKMAKISEDTARKVKLAEGTHKSVGRIFNLKPKHVQKIKLGHLWAHI